MCSAPTTRYNRTMVDHAREQPDPHATRADISNLCSEITDLCGEMRAMRESMERRFAANDQRLERLQWRMISAPITLSAVVGGAIKYL